MSGRNWLDRVLPGAGRLARGDRAGVPLLLVWLAGLGIVGGARSRIAHTLRGGAPDEWLALFTLFVLLGGSWWLGNRARHTATKSASQWAFAWRRFTVHRAALLDWEVVGIENGTSGLRKDPPACRVLTPKEFSGTVICDIEHK